MTFDDLKTKVLSYYSEAPIAQLKKAYEFAEKAHQNQKRSSGDPYLVHPLEVAIIIAELKLDMPSLITGLLHDTVEDTPATLEQIEKEFGNDVALLVDGVTKLNKMTFKTSEEKQAENFRKMILAMAKDIRVILVKLCDRLNNMRTLDSLPPEKRERISHETLDIYAPIANRLGISWIKAELEDHCLKYLRPEAYAKISEKVSRKKLEREKFIEDYIVLIEERLKEYDVVGQVSGRAKHFYSIYKKMERRQVDFDEIQDVIAFRILVDNITECYKSLGVIHSAFKPIPGRFKDYIAMPKANQYQSLHTTVIGSEGDRIEIQIRTFEMNQVAESGIAAHWAYKEGKKNATLQENLVWVNRLLEWQKDLADPSEFLETVKIDLFAEDVFVFTPNGEVKELPYGATPLDFAYAVHTDVGNKCTGARVNGKIVPLKYRLKSGDTIEILTSPTGAPSKDWLSIVKTSRAKAKIRAVIKQQERDQALIIGKEILEREFKQRHLSFKAIEKTAEYTELLASLSQKTSEDLFIGVGYGRISLDRVLDAVTNKSESQETKDENALERIQHHARKPQDSKNAVLVANLGDIMTRFGKCCSPLPGDRILGFITRGRGVSIHSVNCAKLLDHDQERRIEVSWNEALLKTGIKRAIRIRIFCNDQPGLLALMTQTISAGGVNIISANIRTSHDRKAVAIFELEVLTAEQLAKTITALESKKGIISVERVRN